MSLHAQIRHYLKIRHLTAAELSRRAQVSKQSLSDWMSGIVPKSLPELVRIAAVLGTTLDELLREDGAPRARRPRALTAETWSPADEMRDTETMPDARTLYRVLTFAGYMRQLSPSWELVTGWSLAELESRPVTEFIHHADRHRARLQLGRNTQGVPTFNFDKRIVAKSGSIIWLRSDVIPTVELRQSICVGRDVTHEYPLESDDRQTFAFAPLLAAALHCAAMPLSPTRARFVVTSAARPQALVKCYPSRLSMALLGLLHDAAEAAALARPDAPEVGVRCEESGESLLVSVEVEGSMPTKSQAVGAFLWKTLGAESEVHKTERNMRASVRLPLSANFSE